MKDVGREIWDWIARQNGYDLNAPLLPVGTRVQIGGAYDGKIHWGDTGDAVITEVRPGKSSDWSYVLEFVSGIEVGNEDGREDQAHWTCRPAPDTCAKLFLDSPGGQAVLRKYRKPSLEQMRAIQEGIDLMHESGTCTS